MRVPVLIGVGVACILAIGTSFYVRAKSRVNKVALSAAPKGVTVVEAQPTTYRPTRHYVSTLESWVEADVGPQLIAAYVDTVLVRPGAEVKRGQVLATLDCRASNASNQAVAMQARAIEAKQKALANEAARVHSLLDGGYVAPNEAEQKLAGSESQLAELMATQAKLAGTSLAVNDCILRAPFDGEVSRRLTDPGAFVRPGAPMITVVDRSNVRATTEVPESDFGAVAPGTPVKLQVLATSAHLTGTIARRAPTASSSTRTIHIEIDLPNPNRSLPVGTTADLVLEVGDPQPATQIPGVAATVRGEKATVMIVDDDHAKKMTVPVLGESAGTLFVSTALNPGTRVITEGRSLVADGDQVVAKLEPPPTTPPQATGGAKR